MEKNPLDKFRRLAVTATVMAKGSKTAEIYLYDQIGASFWDDSGMTAKQFAERLKAVDGADKILLRLNSPGGDVFEGAAMYDLITQSAIPIHVRVDGLAASAAFTVAMAGKSIEIGEAGMMMMHNARGMAFGTSKEMAQTADILDKISGQMAELYAKRSGMPVAEVKQLMDAETWMTPDECVAKGFAGSICKPPKDDEDPKMGMAAIFDLEKAYQKVPDALKHRVAIAACARMTSSAGKSLAISKPQGQELTMDEPKTAAPAAAEVTQDNYGPVAAEINKMGRDFNIDVDTIDSLLCKRATIQDAREIIMGFVLRRQQLASAKSSGLAQPTVDALTEKEKDSYSVARAILSLADPACPAPLEREISAALTKQVGRASRGLFIPTRLRPQATSLDTKTDAAGKYTVVPLVQELIDLLRARTKVIQLGATVLSGLSAPLQFPRHLTGTTGSWMAENSGSDVSAVNATFGVLTLSPKTYQATTAYSRQLLAQSSIDIENFVRTDLAEYHAIALDTAAINGSGDNNQPLGILQTDNIGDVAFGTNGGPPTYANIVDLETKVAAANADEAGMKFLTTPGIRGVLKKVGQLDQTTSPIPTWVQDGNSPGMGTLIGYPAAVSNCVPSTLTKGAAGGVGVCHAIIFGYWPTVLIGEWGVLEIIVDPYALKKQGMIEVTSFQMVDVGLRHPQAIAAMQDARLSGTT